MANRGLIRVKLSNTDLPDLLLPGEYGVANAVLYPVTHSIRLHVPSSSSIPRALNKTRGGGQGWPSQEQSQTASPRFLPIVPCTRVHCALRGQSILRGGGSGPWKSKESLVENSSFGETHSHPAFLGSAVCKLVLGAWFRLSEGCWGDAG